MFLLVRQSLARITGASLVVSITLMQCACRANADSSSTSHASTRYEPTYWLGRSAEQVQDIFLHEGWSFVRSRSYLQGTYQWQPVSADVVSLHLSNNVVDKVRIDYRGTQPPFEHDAKWVDARGHQSLEPKKLPSELPEVAFTDKGINITDWYVRRWKLLQIIKSRFPGTKFEGLISRKGPSAIFHSSGSKSLDSAIISIVRKNPIMSEQQTHGELWVKIP